MSPPYGQTSVQIAHYHRAAITKDVIELLLEHQLFSPDYSVEHAGLLGMYYSYLELGPDDGLTDIWVLRCDGVPVGVAVRALGAEPLVHVFVNPAHRGRGYGTRLILAVKLAMGTAFAHYTPTSAGLFERMGLMNARDH